MAKKLTYDEICARVSAILDKALEDHKTIFYGETDSGMYFSLDGFTAYYLPNHNLAFSLGRMPESIKADTRGTMEKAFSENAFLVTAEERGKDTNSPRTIRKLYNYAVGNVYANNAFFSDVPKSAAVYISGKSKPILCGIMERGQLFLYKMILPIRFEEWRFIKKEARA